MILLTNHDKKLIDVLMGRLDECIECNIAVAFIRSSGVNPIITAVEGIRKRGGKVKILTADQMGITERDAIETLLDVGAEIKVFVNAKIFHPKVYIFKSLTKSEYILGSSNISRSAFFNGVEWNLFFDNSNPVAADLDKHFERIWGSEEDVQFVNKDNLKSFFNPRNDKWIIKFAAKEDAVISDPPKTLKEIIANNVTYSVTKRADKHSTWNYNLSVSKVNRLIKQGPFYVIVRCNFESDSETVFAISSDHLKSQIFPYANQGKSSRYLFEVNKRTLQFNWQRSIKMDGKPFVIA